MKNLTIIVILLAAFGVFSFGAGVYEIISNLQVSALIEQTKPVDHLSPIIHAGMGIFFVIISRIIWKNRLKL